jgi:prophage regulatory protein
MPESDLSRSADAATAQPDEELWSLKMAKAKTGLSLSTIYAHIADGTFPAQRRLGLRRIAWLSTEIKAWIASRPRDRVRCSLLRPEVGR